MEYIIERRYEYLIRGGKTWSNWFTYKRVNSEDEANAIIKECKKKGELIKKLKGEYRIVKSE